ncbi:MAG: hypothetical protein SF187_22730 [Deltaproteobacteria bacterium]|nr:hypothetical protein [Deltaproteobacteria bacterium]
MFSWLASRWHFALALAGAACSLLWAGCSADAQKLAWRISFNNEADATRAVRVTAFVNEGGCGGPSVYRSTIARGQRAEAPPVLSPGRHGFGAQAVDVNCHLVAQGCTERDPSDSLMTVQVQLSSSPDVACAAAACLDTICAALVSDAGATDDGAAAGQAGCPTRGGCPAVVWRQIFGQGRSDTAAGLQPDGLGGFWLGATYLGTLALNAGALNTSQYDALLVRLDGSGRPVGGTVIGGDGLDAAGALATMPTGELLFGTKVTGAVKIGNQTFKSGGDSDGLLVQATTAGQPLRGFQLASSAIDQITAVAALPLGGFAVALESYGSPLIAGARLANEGSYDAAVIAFDAGGSVRWLKRIASAGRDAIRALAATEGGGVYVQGGVSGPFNEGSVQFGARGEATSFLLELSPEGTARRAFSWPSPVAEDMKGALLARDDVLYFAATLLGTFDVSGAKLVSEDARRPLVGKLGPQGVEWARLGNGALSGRASAIALLGPQTVTFAGDVSGPVDWGGGALGGGVATAAFVVGFSSNGNHLFSRAFGATAVQVAGLVSDPSEQTLTLAGDFDGLMQFSPTDAVMARERDIFVLQLRP